MIPEVVILEIRANPTHVMGWFSTKLRKAWELIFPLTATSRSLGYLPLTNLTWGRMLNPWLSFLIDKPNPEVGRKVVEIRSTSLPDLGVVQGGFERVAIEKKDVGDQANHNLCHGESKY